MDRDQQVAAQVRDVAASSPLWRERFAVAGLSPDSVGGVADLDDIPAVGERDVSPDGDPSRMAALVCRADEADFALRAPGRTLRRALRLRLTQRDAYRRVIDGETRPTSYTFAGLGLRYPLASTRADLDVVARAGARLWSVLGLTRDDSLVSAVPRDATTDHVALEYAALAAGAAAMLPGDDPTAVAAAVRLVPPTVLAVPSSRAARLLDALGPVPSLRTLLLVGAPTDGERLAATQALAVAGNPPDVAVLVVHAPTGARLLWGECRASAGATGLHTYPDLEVVQTVDADTGESTTASPAELVLTQLGMRGSALLRWRTGDVIARVDDGPCPACGRQVPRVVGTSRGALVVHMDASTASTSGRTVDLRSVAAALVGRTHMQDWRLVVGTRRRDGSRQVVVHLAATDDETQLVVAVATDLRAVAGALPTQLVVSSRDELAQLGGLALSHRMLVESGTSPTHS